MRAMSDRSGFTRRLGTISTLTMALLAISGGTANAGIYNAIPNGEPYLDSAGTHIQAHGGFVLKHEGVYYWVGEDKSHNRATFKGVTMYRSTDLENWEAMGPVLTPDTLDVFGNRVLGHCKVERPKLLFNHATQK